METRLMPSPRETAVLDTQELRAAFLLDELFFTGEVNLIYTDLDRAIVGSVIPTEGTLVLGNDDALKADFFCQRREVGLLNLGAAGSVDVDGTVYEIDKHDCLYIGRGSKEISFSSTDAGDPAVFYLVSYPAHAGYPTTKATRADANRVELGSKDECNERTIFQYIHENGIKSCQLVLGFTEFKPGSIWNTMPCHTHDRRSEVYCYFDVPAAHRVLHMMGQPQETRPLWVADRQVVLSPPWSVHTGCGTASYRFCWAMGGENQAFTDMDRVEIADLR
ncbi:5-dehydro-4-deoxy-D-glucuronate isomerase [Luteolibacter yonseiensis]|uniref:4-deoxy-L-threo-5-hexosulose-uronate ketol-isomerase n=1 Tax=Luteolibacter yonseiensis TaxID=1144680 RepID=A0A934VC40_9BACT|nr:5-dehydro-4-deoxy-D-glucuronate isomerase [Luteolibacter yonseiensis]MBK1817928.1 5-dehydro-4-deoxy-D-glucuronate isomerase [Luteolibacter yonseiensis]